MSTHSSAVPVTVLNSQILIELHALNYSSHPLLSALVHSGMHKVCKSARMHNEAHLLHIIVLPLSKRISTKHH